MKEKFMNKKEVTEYVIRFFEINQKFSEARRKRFKKFLDMKYPTKKSLADRYENVKKNLGDCHEQQRHFKIIRRGQPEVRLR